MRRRSFGHFVQRVAALTIDVLVGAFFMLPALAGVILFVAGGNSNLVNLLTALGYYGGGTLMILYLLFRDGLSRGSIGKRIFGLRVVAVKDGRPCTWSRSLVRNGIAWLAALVLVGLAVEPLLVLLHPRGRRLGDLAAGTEVVELGGR